MKAISLWQPWATLIALGEKRIETRGRRINHRGELAIHAAQRWLPAQSTLLDQEPFRTALAHHGISGGNAVHSNMPRGAIVAVCELIDDIDLTNELEHVPGEFQIGRFEGFFGQYGPGRRGYLLTNIRPLVTPVLCRGMQAMPFTVPLDVELRVREQLTVQEPTS